MAGHSGGVGAAFSRRAAPLACEDAIVGRSHLVLLLAACSDPAAMPDAGVDAAPDAPARILTITPSAFNFGELPLGDSAAPPTQTFAVTNTSPATIDLVSVTVGGAHAADFTVGTNTCGPQLEPDATCNVSLTFDPTGRDMRSAQLEVMGPELATAYVTGNALVANERLIFDPPSRDFSDVGVGETSSFTFNIFNEAATGTFTAAIDPAGTGFSITSSTCDAVALHGTCSVTVSWSPGFSGRHTASLRLTSGGNDSWAAGLGASTSRPLAITPEQGTMGSFLVGQPEATAQHTFTITNASTTTTGALTASFAGAAASAYEVVSNNCTTLAENASCDVVVRLDPTTTTRGSKVAQLVLSDGTSTVAARAHLTGSAYTVLITGTATFPNTTSGQQSAVQTFTIVNASSRDTGTLTTNLGAQFSIASNTCAAGIPANNACTIGVRFTPTSAGAKQATLQLSGTPGGTDSILLTGTGI